MVSMRYIILLSVLVAACAHEPGKAAQPQPPDQAPAPSGQADQDEQDQSDEGDQPVQPAQQDEIPQSSLPKIELTGDMLYEYMLSEIASQRGNDTVAVEGSTRLAEETRDPRIAMRAAHIALQYGQIDKAVESLRIWREADPSSLMARKMLSSVLLRTGKLDEANAELTGMLKMDADNVAQDFIQIYQILATSPDRKAAFKLMRDLAAPYPGVAEAHFGLSELAQLSGDRDLALGEVRKARKLRPEWGVAALLEAELLKDSQPRQSLDVLAKYLKDYPKNSDVRLQYARSLLDQKEYKESRAEFQQLADQSPDNPDMAFAIALISLQLNDLDVAEKELKQSLEKGKKDQDTVQYYLGQLSEARHDEDAALDHYRAVRQGEYSFPATVRIALILSKRGQLQEARDLLHQVKPANSAQRSQMALIEAQFLQDAHQYEEAYQLLQKALDDAPADPDLLYGTAMMAEKIGKDDLFEQLMRKLIQIKPDHAQAYNALGYDLLERNERIPEAMELVQKAFQLAPDDAAIMDSVGWGYYRTGKLDESVKMLRRAFAGSPDPEIAAHLGEVLWMRGDKAEAKKVWQDSLKDNPDNKPLQAVIRKFDP